MSNQAETLFRAYQNNHPIEREKLEFKSLKFAYTVQDQVLALKEANGEHLAGYKISLTSEQTQKMFKTDHPLYGQMTDVTIKKTISLSDFNEPLLELELVFLVDETVNGDDSDDEILRKCRVAPGIEVPDSRYQDWFPKTSFYEVVADGAVNGAIIIGEAGKFDYETLKGVTGKLFYNGDFVKEGQASEVLNHPVNAVKWLAKTLENRGKKLEAGNFVSSGTFILPERLQEGSYYAEYSAVGSVTLEVTK